jgi:hypothetical protein
MLQPTTRPRRNFAAIGNKVYKDWDYRGFTIERLQRLIDRCGQMAKNVNVKIKKKKLGTACTA